MTEDHDGKRRVSAPETQDFIAVKIETSLSQAELEKLILDAAYEVKESQMILHEIF